MSDPSPSGHVVSVDIVSDVMCPWCIVGYRQLEQALAHTGMGARIRWHPFELNPDMPEGGQNLAEHIQQKYGSSPEDSTRARAQLTALGASLGITFAFSDDSRIVNSFLAHQALDFALSQGKQHPLKLALFEAHFAQARDVSQKSVLLEVAQSVGLDAAEMDRVLTSGQMAQSVREKEAFWTKQGVSGVPTMIFEGKYAITGAQGAENYATLLTRLAQEAA